MNKSNFWAVKSQDDNFFDVFGTRSDARTYKRTNAPAAKLYKVSAVKTSATAAKAWGLVDNDGLSALCDTRKIARTVKENSEKVKEYFIEATR